MRVSPTPRKVAVPLLKMRRPIVFSANLICSPSLTFVVVQAVCLHIFFVEYRNVECIV